jgi:hypothetical protein
VRLELPDVATPNAEDDHRGGSETGRIADLGKHY